MGTELKWLVEITEAEYRGPSLNGYSLMEAVQDLSLDQVTSTDTHEHFTVWAVVLHNMYFKWKMVRLLEPDNSLDFSYEKKSFPGLPDPATREKWLQTLADSDRIHEVYVDLLKRLPPDRLEEPIVEWKCTAGVAAAWIAAHDSYHVAQIRNMGVPGL